MRRFFRSLGGRIADFVSSIRFRLTLWFLVILALVLAAFSAFIYASQSRDLRFDAVQDMQAKLTRLDAYFHSDAWQNSNISPADVPGDNGQALLQPSDFIILTTPDGQAVQNWGAMPQGQSHLVSGLLSAENQNRALSVYTQSISVKEQSGTSRSGDYLFVVAPVLRRDALL